MENPDSFEDYGAGEIDAETHFNTADEMIWQSGGDSDQELTQFDAIVVASLLDVKWQGDEIVRSFSNDGIDILPNTVRLEGDMIDGMGFRFAPQESTRESGRLSRIGGFLLRSISRPIDRRGNS